MPDISTWEILVRLLVAAVLGGGIGIERELREHEAGLRTHVLVSVGSALFTLISAYAWTDFDFGPRTGISFDPTRIAAQIVTGIGFLGAGAIIRHGLTVRGLTTAATLWISAAVGMACGAGFFWAAVFGTALALATLGPLRVVSRLVLDKPHNRKLSVELKPGAGAASLLTELEELGVDVQSFALADTGERRLAEVDVRFPHGARPEEVVVRLGDLDDVTAARWTP